MQIIRSQNTELEKQNKKYNQQLKLARWGFPTGIALGVLIMGSLVIALGGN